MAAENKIIYCVIPTSRERKFDLVGFEGEEIYTINYKDIDAVVSDISLSYEECDPTRRNMKTHTLVLEALMKDYTILPARFGLISDSEDKLKGLLQKYYPTLKDYIRRLDNRMEIGVKVFWEKEAMIAELEGKDGSLTKLKEELKTLPPLIAQDKLVKAGEMVRSMIEKWVDRYTDRVYRQLMKVAVDGKKNYPIDMKNIINSAFLVDKAREKDFDALIEKLDSEYGDKINFKYVKPVPPYNFVNLELHLKEVL